MSEREKAIRIIDSIPDSQVCYVLNMLQNFKDALDETADDAFCNHLYDDYIEDTDTQKNEDIPIEKFAENKTYYFWILRLSVLSKR